MSLVHMSGFEGALKNREQKDAGVTFVANGRTGMCAQFAGASPANGYTIALDPQQSRVLFGFAIKFLADASMPQSPVINLTGNEGEEFRITFQDNGQITVTRVGMYGTVANLIIAPATFQKEQWVYVEADVKLHSVEGLFELRVNGTKVGEFLGDTQANNSGPQAYLNTIKFNGLSAAWAGTMQLDDLYILDPTVDGTATQGRAFQNFLGMPRVEALVPVAGVTNQWAGSDGDSVDNHLLVDERPPSETDYVEGTTTGQRELYDFSAPVLNGEILAVDVSAYAASPDGGVNPIKTVRQAASGTTQVGPGFVPGSSYKYQTDEAPKALDPDGNPWTKALLDSTQFGVEVG